MAIPKRTHEALDSLSSSDIEEPAKKRTKYSEVITILVGPDFVVHGKRLAEKSQFFAAAFSKGWKENAEKVVHLPEVEHVDVFEFYVDSVHNPTVILSGDSQLAATNKPLKMAHKTSAELDKIVLRLAQLYVLADMLQDTACKNRTLYCFVDRCHFGLEAACYIFEHTPNFSPARNLLADLLPRKVAYESWQETSSLLPAALLCGIADRYMMDRAGSRNFTEMKKTTYHEK